MEAKRQRVSDLLDAHIKVGKIQAIVGCSRSLVDKVKRLKKAGNGLGRKPGSGGLNKIRSEEFLTGVASEIACSMRRLGKELQVSDRTIRRSMKDLGAVSYVRRRRQLLTDSTKAKRVMKGTKLLT